MGDQVADTINHGTLDQAVCCHPLDHYAYWNEFYQLTSDRALGPGSVGENWTLRGATEHDLFIGDVFRVGEAVVQVSAPRYPCTKQDRKLGLHDFQKRTTETLRTGLYLRVLEGGFVQVGDELRLEARPHPDISVQQVNEHCHHLSDRDFGQRLIALPELSAQWKRIVHYKVTGEWAN